MSSAEFPEAVLTTGVPDSDPGARASQLEQALYKVTHALEAAGILARPCVPLLQPHAPEVLHSLCRPSPAPSLSIRTRCGIT